MQPRRPAAGSVCLWRHVVVLPLCVCLLAAGSAQAAENQVLYVRASETERLRDLLSGKRINASFLDGSRLKGRVKEIQEAFLRVDIKKTSDPNLLPRGLQDLPTDQRCCMDRGGDEICPFPSGSVRRCVRTQAARVRSLCSELSGRPGSP